MAVVLCYDENIVSVQAVSRLTHGSKRLKELLFKDFITKLKESIRSQHLHKAFFLSPLNTVTQPLYRELSFLFDLLIRHFE